jgi:hypothetical protein
MKNFRVGGGSIYCSKSFSEKSEEVWCLNHVDLLFLSLSFLASPHTRLPGQASLPEPFSRYVAGGDYMSCRPSPIESCGSVQVPWLLLSAMPSDPCRQQLGSVPGPQPLKAMIQPHSAPSSDKC